MEAFRQYIVAITAAAILCGIIQTMFIHKSAAPMMKLLCGIFLTFVMIRPIAKLDLQSIDLFAAVPAFQADTAVVQGENIARETANGIIKSRTEAYILDKAEALGVELTVTITLDDAGVPVRAVLVGPVSPAARSALQAVLEEDLGIPKEDQQWNE